MLKGNLTPVPCIGKVSVEDQLGDPGARLLIPQTGYPSVACVHGVLLGRVGIKRGISERWKASLLNVVEWAT